LISAWEQAQAQVQPVELQAQAQELLQVQEWELEQLPLAWVRGQPEPARPAEAQVS
jgi:hypothetical protein